MSDSVTVYGIANCDTIKTAKKWLDKEGIEYSFHDYRKQGLDKDLLAPWIKSLGWESLLNRRGTTWRNLPDDVKNKIGEASAIEVMLDNPAVIKRPLLIRGDRMMLGFSDSQYQEFFS